MRTLATIAYLDGSPPTDLVDLAAQADRMLRRRFPLDYEPRPDSSAGDGEAAARDSELAASASSSSRHVAREEPPEGADDEDAARSYIQGFEHFANNWRGLLAEHRREHPAADEGRESARAGTPDSEPGGVALERPERAGTHGSSATTVVDELFRDSLERLHTALAGGEASPSSGSQLNAYLEGADDPPFLCDVGRTPSGTDQTAGDPVLNALAEFIRVYDTVSRHGSEISAVAPGRERSARAAGGAGAGAVMQPAASIAQQEPRTNPTSGRSSRSRSVRFDLPSAPSELPSAPSRAASDPGASSSNTESEIVFTPKSAGRDRGGQPLQMKNHHGQPISPAAQVAAGPAAQAGLPAAPDTMRRDRGLRRVSSMSDLRKAAEQEALRFESGGDMLRGMGSFAERLQEMGLHGDPGQWPDPLPPRR